VSDLFASSPVVTHAVWLLVQLAVAAALGAALGIVRPVRNEIVPRSTPVVHSQILLAIVGAMIMIIVAESLARAFAIVGAAGLIRYRSRIKDPKDAGVMLIALAVGLATGSGLIEFALLGTGFVIGVLWILESLEPPERKPLELTVTTSNPWRLRAEIEHVLRHKGVTFELRDTAPTVLQYDVAVPFDQNIRKLSALLEELDADDHISVDWDARGRQNAGADPDDQHRGESPRPRETIRSR
jgi:uncharacterized membrane protein YhiD involved in acid resistance